MTKNCIRCGAAFTTPISPFGLLSNAKYCMACGPVVKAERDRATSRRFEAKRKAARQKAKVSA